MPTPSWPGTNGGVGFTGQSPFAAWMSVWQRPEASILTNTWPAPGSGIGRSSMTSPSLNAFTTAAFMTTSPRVISDHHLRLPAIEPTPAKDLPARTFGPPVQDRPLPPFRARDVPSVIAATRVGLSSVSPDRQRDARWRGSPSYWARIWPLPTPARGTGESFLLGRAPGRGRTGSPRTQRPENIAEPNLSYRVSLQGRPEAHPGDSERGERERRVRADPRDRSGPDGHGHRRRRGSGGSPAARRRWIPSPGGVGDLRVPLEKARGGRPGGGARRPNRCGPRDGTFATSRGSVIRTR